jgi:hypothetical protein
MLCSVKKEAAASMLQMSTFTRVPSIPRDQSYRDFPVTVRVTVAPPEIVQRERALVDVVAVIDLRWSMGFDDKYGYQPNDRLVRVKEAMAKVIENLGVDAQNRPRIWDSPRNHRISVKFTHFGEVRNSQKFQLNSIFQSSLEFKHVYKFLFQYRIANLPSYN